MFLFVNSSTGKGVFNVLCRNVNMPEVVSMLMPHRIVLWSVGMIALHN